ncbi:phosphoglucomutase (alpha-D-glucose-1,6-bisphosphate-dependent) [Cupriavidus sp. IDO]|uniref:phosphoglucomutase (alpha-D-glucose-1,6-bisphosphate-dependent) n=1 Tax=Cupriavidus sp. IDO TaxID=1539142 RepID=UPI000578ED37|nr:phosphoglucomutase (alpha-D-glucose-1,6-bisphosphate-dependent) [Cupriavidus sp. IDO]KWR91338.1 phosphoglucomutase [Cupriavidus sp. IDO]
MNISPLAGKPAPPSILVNIPQLMTAYYTDTPDPSVAAQRVTFGTSGHRGSSLTRSFNEWHVLAISQAICEFRAGEGYDGPLFLGIDTHALSKSACASALEVLAGNGVDVLLAEHDEYTPTPAVSLAILAHNRGRTNRLADGIVVTPSHNPPDNGGFKYNPPNGGAADTATTSWIEARANELLRRELRGVRRMPFERAIRLPTTQRYDYLDAYVSEIGKVIDMAAIRAANIRLGVDPLGGAGVHYWGAIGERYGLDLTVIDDEVDPTFRFMSVDWDGQIRMDPSSPYAIRRLLELKSRFDIAFACDTDHDRHGIVTQSVGLLASNHYLAVSIDYLFRHRPMWPSAAGVGKTVVSSQMIDRVCARLGRKVYEVPVGFKWFCEGLSNASLGFCGEESAGASFLRLGGTVWTTDKDGLAPCLLAAEMTARLGLDPGEIDRKLTQELGDPLTTRVEAPATLAQRTVLSGLSPQQIKSTELAGESIERILVRAPGNDAPIGGLKVIAKSGWFAARPSGTEDLYKIYAESFRGEEHLRRVVEAAQAIVDAALKG